VNLNESNIRNVQTDLEKNMYIFYRELSWSFRGSRHIHISLYYLIN